MMHYQQRGGTPARPRNDDNTRWEGDLHPTFDWKSAVVVGLVIAVILVGAMR